MSLFMQATIPGTHGSIVIMKQGHTDLIDEKQIVDRTQFHFRFGQTGQNNATKHQAQKSNL